MNKIDKLLNSKRKDILSVYFTAGYPKLEDTNNIINELENNAVDLIEIGIPFSDPVADGPIIQYSNTSSIENGMTLNLLFDQLKMIKTISNIPKLLMGYFNPILKFGVEKLCKKCNEVGIDGLIIPDLPLHEFEINYKDLFQEYGIHFIFLVSPQTSRERLKQIDQQSTSFIYAVSTNSTTGGNTDLNLQAKYFSNLKNQLKSPFLIGFGVRDHKTFSTACEYANGAIIGSSFIKSLSEKGELEHKITNFTQQIRK
jgi:tryptophan synthase alpha chain